jgi:hypothetical protein
MNAIEKAIDKVRKLLALSKSANENEAASAAAKAAAIMAEHQLSEARLEIETGVSHAEILEDVEIPESAKKIPSWKGTLMVGLAALHNCRVYGSGGQFHVFGSRSSIQTIIYTYKYLQVEIERLTKAGWAAFPNIPDAYGRTINARRWTNAFRLGCASRIQARLIQIKKDRDAADHALALSGNQAMVLVEKRALAVHDAFEAFKKERGMRLRSSTARCSSRSGYAAGQAAGESVSLGGERRALGAAAKQIGGRS